MLAKLQCVMYNSIRSTGRAHELNETNMHCCIAATLGLYVTANILREATLLTLLNVSMSMYTFVSVDRN